MISSNVKAEMARRTNGGKMLEPGWHLPDVAPETTPQPPITLPKEGGKTMMANPTRVLVLALLDCFLVAGLQPASTIYPDRPADSYRGEART